MNLRDRLERLRRLGLAPAGTPAVSSPSPRCSPAPVLPALEALALSTRPTPWGEACFRDHEVPAGEPRGQVAPERLTSVPLEPLLRFGRVEAPADAVDGLLFLDTETTGLAGGTGTLVVVAGLARLDGECLRIRQFVLVDPTAEAAFLDALADELDRARLLVTFNGRRFDWPVLESRFVLNRGLRSMPSPPHLDLLYPARRLYGADLPSCRLTELEARVLGARRAADIPGSEVPARYRLLLEGRPEPFAEVLTHNRHDLETLAALTAHAAQLSYLGLADGGPPPAAGPSQLLALAGSCLEQGDFHRAQGLLARAVELAGRRGRGRTWFTAVQRLAAVYRRMGRWDQAAALWSEVAASYPPGAVWALVELAKEREHRCRDLAGALAHTQRALEICRRRLSLGSARARRDLADLEHRRRRLLRRLGRRPAV